MRTAMVLAAGRGERMRPLTDRRPKPLLEVGGRSLIDRQLDALAAIGVQRVVINLAWLGDMIRDALGDGSARGMEIRYCQEPEGALESAGGIIEALPLLDADEFWVVNGDVFTDAPLDRLTVTGDDLAALYLVDNPDHNPGGDFHLDGNRVRDRGEPRLTFAGLGLYRRALFEGLEPGRRPLAPLLREAMEESRVAGLHHRGRWQDVGTPERLSALDRALGGDQGGT